LEYAVTGLIIGMSEAKDNDTVISDRVIKVIDKYLKM